MFVSILSVVYLHKLSLSKLMNIIYLDRLSIFSILAVICSRVYYSHIFYFNKSFVPKIIINVFVRFGILKNRPQLVKFSLDDIGNERGECLFVKISEDIKNYCFKVSDKEFVCNSFLKGFKQHFDFKYILLFFEKILAVEIEDIAIFFNAARWHSRNSIDTASETIIIFFHEKKIWSKYLSQYAVELNIKPVEYRSCTKIFSYFAMCNKIKIQNIKSKLNTLSINKNKIIRKKEKVPSQAINNGKTPIIASWYTGKSVTFDSKKRSEFFWLMGPDISREQVLVYFDRTDVSLPEDCAEILNKESIKYLALSSKAANSKDIPIWHPSRKYRQLKRYFIMFIIKSYFVCTMKMNFVPFFFIAHMLYFVLQYSYWLDFFSSNNIKINVSPNDFTKMYAPKNLALEKNGGVSISYHWSNYNWSLAKLSGCSTVMFSFGPAYKRIWEENRSIIGNIIYSGYITDYSFKEVKENSLKLRNQLLSKGVKFIICFFDENSSNNRMSVIPNKRSAEIYEFFIRKMLEDETMGLIFKPGYPKTLYKRIASISNLIEKAKETGRCIFMDKGSYVTEQYPTEAAQAADLCVGLLLSGTVALESYLSGIPTVFLDLERLYSNPAYQWGNGKVVFDSLGKLFSAINQVRYKSEGIPGFGDLSSWVKDKDPFRDGKASLRMGQYIKWLFEKFKAGETREEAIEYANYKYAKYWGKENVVKWH